MEEVNKRKRDVEDDGDREQKKVHVEDSRISIEDLHLDVGKKYLLCRTRKTPFFLKDQLFPRLVSAELFKFLSLAHHLIKYLVNMSMMCSPSSYSAEFFGRPLRFIFVE